MISTPEIKCAHLGVEPSPALPHHHPSIGVWGCGVGVLVSHEIDEPKLTSVEGVETHPKASVRTHVMECP